MFRHIDIVLQGSGEHVSKFSPCRRFDGIYVQKIEICPDDNCCTLFPLVSFTEVSHIRFFKRGNKVQKQYVSPCALSPYFFYWVLGVLTRHVLVVVFAQGGVLRNPNEWLCGQIPNIPLRDIMSLYMELVPPHMEYRRARGQMPNPTSCVSCALCRASGKEDGSSTSSRA
jgi:hypothetical protein